MYKLGKMKQVKQSVTDVTDIFAIVFVFMFNGGVVATSISTLSLSSKSQLQSNVSFVDKITVGTLYIVAMKHEHQSIYHYIECCFLSSPLSSNSYINSWRV